MAVKRWTGSTWEIYAGADTSPGFAATDGRAGRRTWVGANTPTAPTDGDIWIDQDTATNSIPASAFDAKGDLMVGTGPDTYTRQAVGTDGQVLVADSSQADGVVWSHASSRQGLVNVVPTSVTISSGSASVAANGAITLTSAGSPIINGCFTSSHENYLITWSGVTSLATFRYQYFNLTSGGGAAAAANWNGMYTYMTDTANPVRSFYSSGPVPFGAFGNVDCQAVCTVFSPQTATRTRFITNNGQRSTTDSGSMNGIAWYSALSQYDGFTLTPDGVGGVITGTLRIYGYGNGA